MTETSLFSEHLLGLRLRSRIVSVRWLPSRRLSAKIKCSTCSPVTFSAPFFGTSPGRPILRPFRAPTPAPTRPRTRLEHPSQPPVSGTPPPGGGRDEREPKRGEGGTKRPCTREAGSTGASGALALPGEGHTKAPVSWVCAPLPAHYEWLAAAPTAHALGFSSMSLLMGKGSLLALSASGETALPIYLGEGWCDRNLYGV